MKKPAHWTRRMAVTFVPAASALIGAMKATPVSASVAPAETAGETDKPFSEHRLALQLSDHDPAKHRLVLSVAFNMLAIYDVDRVSIEVVVFADGMGLLHVDSPSRALVDSLITQGVTFDACVNTIETIERDTGRPFPLNPKAKRVQAGVAKILVLTEAGYTLVRP